MPTTYAWPRTEEETVDHLREHHGLMVRSMAEWRQLFSRQYLPSTVHRGDHDTTPNNRPPHRHKEIWAAP
ncbi:MAG TPA: hypothetical protein VIV12_23530 [Streptosporangiaceae bacterium]